jgi:hypothetical protein
MVTDRHGSLYDGPRRRHVAVMKKFLTDQQKIVHIENDGQGSTRPLLGGIWLTDNSTFPRSKGAAANGGLDKRKTRRHFIRRGEKVQRGSELEDVLHTPREGTMSSLVPVAPRLCRGEVTASTEYESCTCRCNGFNQRAEYTLLHHDYWR